jgi:two-component system OmpR family response regulator
MRILLAEDDDAIGERVRTALAEAGYAVDRVADGAQAEFLGQTEAFDLAVLDLGLPGLDGISVLHRWREAGQRFPVIVLTARARWHDKLAGFDAGADDYLTKPFQMEELVIRVRALIRRATGHASPLLRCGALELDTHGAKFTFGGESLSLTSQEFRILAYLIHHPDKLITRAELGEHVYEGGYDPDSNVIDVLIGRIRRKLGAELIHTVRGQGFRLSESP